MKNRDWFVAPEDGKTRRNKNASKKKKQSWQRIIAASRREEIDRKSSRIGKSHPSTW
jgi:hypothetical protein